MEMNEKAYSDLDSQNRSWEEGRMGQLELNWALTDGKY